MFLKITIIAIVAFIATSDGAKVWDGLSAKWAANVSDGFYELPTTLYAAWSEGWTRISGVEAPHGFLAVCYQSDPRFVLLFSTRTGKVAGHQVGVPVAEIDRSRVPNFYYSANPGFTRKNLNGEDYFTATALYKEDETGGTRQIWLERDGRFEKIPTTSDLLISETPFYAKRCVDRMGQHFYQVNSTTSVSTRFPWFLLIIGKDVIGIGFQSIGRVSSVSGRTWFETIENSQIAKTIPDVPARDVEVIASDGLVSLHVWFKKNPVAIKCSDECTAEDNESEQSSGYRAIRKRRALGSGNVC